MLVLAQHTIAGDEQLDIIAHKAVERIFRRAHNRFDAQSSQQVFELKITAPAKRKNKLVRRPDFIV